MQNVESLFKFHSAFSTPSVLTPASKFIFDNQGHQVLMQFEGEYMIFIYLFISQGYL